MLIHPAANIRGLATAVITSALSDMTSPDDEIALDALEWFYSEDYLFLAGLCDVTDYPKFDPDQKITAKVKGQKRKVFFNSAVRKMLSDM